MSIEIVTRNLASSPAISNQEKKDQEQSPAIKKINQAIDVAKPMQAVAPAANAEAHKLLKLLRTFGEDSVTARVIRTFGNPEDTTTNYTIPELKWQDQFHRGGTGYIDGIKPSHLSHSVMWGIDPANRLYIAKKMEASDQSQKKLKIGVETFFQRYSGDGNIWTSGGHYALNDKGREIRVVASRLNSEEFALFQKLAKGEEVLLKSYSPNLQWKAKLAS